jgi:cysteine-rich repeat protein
MSRSLHAATLVLACAALVPACLLDGSPLPGETGGDTGGAMPTGGGGAGGAPAGGAGGAMAVCGNGEVEPGEECDDQNTTAKAGCDTFCLIEAGYVCSGQPSVCVATCGTGQLDSGEECDDGNLTAGDGCGDNCQIEGGWKCSQPDGDMDKSLCEPVCGDGQILGKEVCDDGDNEDTNGCKANCLAVNGGWICNDVTGGPDSCDTICGDGIVVADECEDGNPVPTGGDGCSAECLVEHQCGNGIVEPTEACDGGTGCADNCTLVDPESVCAKALLIEPKPEDIDPDTGVRTSYYQNDSERVAVADADVTLLAQDCDADFNFPVLHSYTTGPRPSVVTVEALEKQMDGATNTFGKTVVWVFRDCPNRADYEGCDDNSGMGDRSLFTTGFLPPRSTIYIVLAGEGGGGDKGVYHLKVTEQPVKLFFHESFGPETAAGEYALPMSLTADPVADGGWATCVALGAPCFGVDLDSHTGGALAFTKAGTTEDTIAVIRTPMVDLKNLQFAYGQFTYRYFDGVTGSDLGQVTAFDDASADAGVTFTDDISGRRSLEMPKSDKAFLTFTFDDDEAGDTGAGKFFIDDIYIYGY